MQREGRRAMYEPPTGVIGSSGKEGEERCARLLGFRQWGAQSEEQNGLFLALKQGNVATFGATSRRYREELCQRRDVRGNVVTFQRVGLNNVATLILNVATFQRGSKSTSRHWVLTSRRSRGCKNPRRDVGNPRRDVTETLKINVATLKLHVATFQRRVRLTSRR